MNCMLQWLTWSLGFSSLNITCVYIYIYVCCMYILKYKMKKRVWWENLELGGRFKIFNTGGYIMRTACRKFISTGGLHSWTACRKFISTGGWHKWTACRNLFLHTVLSYPPVEIFDFHRHPAQAVLQSACEKGLGTACIVVLCTSVNCESTREGENFDWF